MAQRGAAWHSMAKRGAARHSVAHAARTCKMPPPSASPSGSQNRASSQTTVAPAAVPRGSDPPTLAKRRGSQKASWLPSSNSSSILQYLGEAGRAGKGGAEGRDGGQEPWRRLRVRGRQAGRMRRRLPVPWGPPSAAAATSLGRPGGVVDGEGLVVRCADALDAQAACGCTGAGCCSQADRAAGGRGRHGRRQMRASRRHRASSQRASGSQPGPCVSTPSPHHQ